MKFKNKENLESLRRIFTLSEKLKNEIDFDINVDKISGFNLSNKIAVNIENLQRLLSSQERCYQAVNDEINCPDEDISEIPRRL